MNRPVTPLLTVDTIIRVQPPVSDPNLPLIQQPIILIERRNAPFGWALPGGFVDLGETVEEAARREAREETGLNIELLDLLGVYSDPRRDARGHTVSVVFTARAHGTPKADDDAAQALLFTPPNWPDQLAFDHQDILDDYIRSISSRA